MKEMSKIVLQNIEALLPGGKVEKTSIAIEGNTIAAIGAVPQNWQPDMIIDGTEKLAVPGFVNSHTHAAMTLFRSYADDMLLMDWLQSKIWPAEANLTSDDVYWGTQLAIAEMIKSGTTTFMDMYFFMPEVAKAVQQSGIRAVLSRGMAGIAPTAQQALTESEELYNQWHGGADGRITVMLGPHAPYTCPPDYLAKVVDLAHKLNCEIHIHLAETADEVKTCYDKYGKSPIALMNDIGVFDCGTLAAHCVHLSPSDIEIMAPKGVRVAHNPGSNMKLASGIAPIPELLSAGIVTGLGTDGAASNNNLDMVEEIRLAALLHKVNRLDPLLIPAATAIDMATCQGAKAVGLGNITGKLAPGYRADITIFDMHASHWYPRHERASLLVYSASSADVHTVIVDGKILLDNHKLTTIDEDKLMAEVQQRGMRLVK